MTNFAQLKNSNLLSYPATFNTIGQPFILLTSVDSTNNYAMAKVREGIATHGAVFFALEQTAGKGQRGKVWHTRKGENIILSLVLNPSATQPDAPFLLSASIALACYDFYKNLAGENTLIKWPNDIYWRDRKAGGILIENIFGTAESGWQWAIVGIGININQTEFESGLGKPVSLKQITGKSYDVTTLATTLCECVEKRFSSFRSGDYAAILTEYNQALYKRDQKVLLKKDSAVFETTVRGVSSSGKLMTSDTLEREFDFGEVSWVDNLKM